MKLYIPDPAPPQAVEPSLFNTFDLEIDTLLGASRTRANFKVDGGGMTVAVLDTGLRVTHRCFTGRVIETRNFTSVGASATDVTDNNGHGTNVTGIIAADTPDERRGIAPGAQIVALKVIPALDFSAVLAALHWIDENEQRLGISVVNLSLGVPGINLSNDAAPRAEAPELASIIKKLHDKHIAVIVSAGNDYKRFEREGMSIPAIFREVISVGAVYDASVGSRTYGDGAQAFTTRADQITPFTQRLSKRASPDCYTDILSAGAAATSAGSKSDDDTSVQDGTSQAAPTVAGVILLMQQHYRRLTGRLPPVPLLQDVLRSTSKWIVDDGVDDNVGNTGESFPRLNAFESLVALDRSLKLALL